MGTERKRGTGIKDTVKAPFNYTGNKHRIINQLEELFPSDIGTMVDLFCGGCDVTVNTPAKVKYANDNQEWLIDIMRTIQQTPIEDILGHIDMTIDEWGLSKENLNAFLGLRDFYNQTRNPLDLYTLMCFSFNNQFRFNRSYEYNSSFGRNRGGFTGSMRENLIAFKERIGGVNLSARDFRDFDFSVLHKGDFLYADPPYRISCAVYNERFRGWDAEDDRNLMNLLDELDGRGVKFALSNVTEHKGVRNEGLMRWMRKYHVHEVKVNYGNCNYHREHRELPTREVLIVNY